MPKKPEPPPDKKQIDKALKTVKEVCDQLKACDKDFKEALAAAKELDKMLASK